MLGKEASASSSLQQQNTLWKYPPPRRRGRPRKKSPEEPQSLSQIQKKIKSSETSSSSTISSSKIVNQVKTNTDEPHALIDGKQLLPPGLLVMVAFKGVFWPAVVAKTPNNRRIQRERAWQIQILNGGRVYVLWINPKNNSGDGDRWLDSFEKPRNIWPWNDGKGPWGSLTSLQHLLKRASKSLPPHYASSLKKAIHRIQSISQKVHGYSWPAFILQYGTPHSNFPSGFFWKYHEGYIPPTKSAFERTPCEQANASLLFPRRRGRPKLSGICSKSNIHESKQRDDSTYFANSSLHSYVPERLNRINRLSLPLPVVPPDVNLTSPQSSSHIKKHHPGPFWAPHNYNTSNVNVDSDGHFDFDNNPNAHFEDSEHINISSDRSSTRSISMLSPSHTTYPYNETEKANSKCNNSDIAKILSASEDEGQESAFDISVEDVTADAKLPIRIIPRSHPNLATSHYGNCRDKSLAVQSSDYFEIVRKHNPQHLLGAYLKDAFLKSSQSKNGNSTAKEEVSSFPFTNPLTFSEFCQLASGKNFIGPQGMTREEHAARVLFFEEFELEKVMLAQNHSNSSPSSGTTVSVESTLIPYPSTNSSDAATALSTEASVNEDSDRKCKKLSDPMLNLQLRYREYLIGFQFLKMSFSNAT